MQCEVPHFFVLLTYGLIIQNTVFKTVAHVLIEQHMDCFIFFTSFSQLSAVGIFGEKTDLYNTCACNGVCVCVCNDECVCAYMLV